jgi:hypothetical protein
MLGSPRRKFGSVLRAVGGGFEHVEEDGAFEGTFGMVVEMRLELGMALKVVDEK